MARIVQSSPHPTSLLEAENSIAAQGWRPFLHSNVMFSETPTGVEFHNDFRRFSVDGPGAYKAFRAAAPLFEGDVPFSDALEYLSTTGAQTITLFESELHRHDMLTRLAPETPSVAQYKWGGPLDGILRLLANYTPTPIAVLERISHTPFVVHCDHEESAQLIKDSLEENGCSMVQCSGLSPDTSRMRPLLSLSWNEARYATAETKSETKADYATSIIVRRAGNGLVITSHTTEEAATAARVLEVLATEKESSEAPEALIRMAGIIAAFEAFKIVSRVMPATLTQAIVRIDLSTGEVSQHQLGRQHDHSDSPLFSLVDPLLGFAPKFLDDDLTQMPLRLSQVSATGPDQRRWIITGWALDTLEAARERVVEEATARVLLSQRPSQTMPDVALKQPTGLPAPAAIGSSQAEAMKRALPCAAAYWAFQSAVQGSSAVVPFSASPEALACISDSQELYGAATSTFLELTPLWDCSVVVLQCDDPTLSVVAAGDSAEEAAVSAAYGHLALAQLHADKHCPPHDNWSHELPPLEPKESGLPDRESEPVAELLTDPRLSAAGLTAVTLYPRRWLDTVPCAVNPAVNRPLIS
ncbi:hypothetical protein [Corynebacterium pseudotuberculosis]|uniref:hypothetical protein n=1 Tax=Corynebacterium pseudotuberculosis TaxID=1719 RepID=UPI0007194423|nr:hypothetical protein [Corynebacterium pseudotuberculosis]ALP34276.1 Hypothetical protein CpN1_1613 [Corynebacterium pseudotuberculosis]ALR34214.1 Hypothetical protein CpPA01_1555 [Corynebacterium pseudotuberculosis]ALU21979.1 hypothetical protein AN398_07770 [Corynebacterium pseudotuberculosis]ANH24306.1 Hypothetical protein CpE55_1626 [Corynebacterium pseudotuberculosis]APX36575.1 hypothetical protein CpPA05_09195 [Corynebacterium pseudotuberculosis]